MTTLRVAFLCGTLSWHRRPRGLVDRRARSARRSAKTIEFSTRVVDRDGRLLRAYATPEGRWRLPATDRRCRSALLRGAVRLRGQALPRPSRRRSAGAHARGVPARSQRPHPLRRLDADHAGGAAAGAAQRPQLPDKTPPDRARGRDRARADQGRGAFALSRSGALWRQYRGRARRLARLFRQGAAAAFARRGGAARRSAAIPGVAAAGSLGRGGAQRAQPRARPLCGARHRAGRRDRARQGRTGADRAARHAHAGAACGRSRGRAKLRRGSEIRLTIDADLQKKSARSWRASAAGRWCRRSAPTSRSPSWSSTMRPARSRPMSARPTISTRAAPARST